MFRPTLLTLLVLIHGAAIQAATVTLEDLALPGPNTFYNGSPAVVPIPPPDVVFNGSFTSQGATFNNEFQVQDFFGTTYTFWNGFAYSNVTDNVTAGFGNQHSAITGSGFGGSANYAIGFDGSPGFVTAIALPAGESPVSLRVSNTTYTYRAIVNGNDGGANFARQFGDDPNLPGGGNQGFPDLLQLTITGLDGGNLPTGVINVALADYTNANNALDFALNDWLLVDLTSLGAGTERLEFRMTTTDVSMFGNLTFPNTPLYFALDNLITVPQSATVVPEPGSAGVALVVACIGLVTLLFRTRPNSACSR